MKKTLIVTLEYPPQIGGIATYIDQMAQSLPSEDVIVLCPPMAGAKEFDENRPFLIIRKNLLGGLWPKWLKMYFLVKKIVKTYGVEVVHVHHVLPVGYIARRLKRKLGVPYLVFSHGTDVTKISEKKRKMKLASLVMQGAEQIIFNSNNLKTRFLEKLPKFADKSSVMYPCPDMGFSEKPDEAVIQKMKDKYALEGKKVVLTVSRMVPGKGFMHLLRLMPAVLQRVPYMVWFIVGDGPQREDIIAHLRKYNLQNSVRFIGQVPHEDLRDYYYLADIFLLLTHPYKGVEEGLGLVFLEAAACGKPVIAGRSGGVEEAVLDEQTGIVLDVDQEPESIIESIVELMKDEDRATELGKNGQQRIQTEFVWENQLQIVKKWM